LYFAHSFEVAIINKWNIYAPECRLAGWVFRFY
jgi:hypothetical protein